MLRPGTPHKITFNRESEVNGAVTWIGVFIQTSNYLEDGDTVTLEFPEPIRFTITDRPKCLGASNNLASELPCTVKGLSTMEITLKLQSSEEKEGPLRIESGQVLMMRITGMVNPPSFKPTESIRYSVKSRDFDVLEFQHQRNGLQNTKPGALSSKNNGIVPDTFKQGAAAKYTLELRPINYEQNMKIYVTLPPQVTFATKKVNCAGLSGTDTPTVKCVITSKGEIVIQDAVKYQKLNPKLIRIEIGELNNPNKTVISKSFGVKTVTEDGFTLDNINQNMTVNFYCAYPCAEC